MLYICPKFETNIKQLKFIKQMKQVLKSEYLDQIKTDEALVGKIARATGKSFQTIKRWAADNDEKLTMLSALNAIREYLKLAKSVSLTEEVKDEKQAA